MMDIFVPRLHYSMTLALLTPSLLGVLLQCLMETRAVWIHDGFVENIQVTQS
jgi:hypothetical protein